MFDTEAFVAACQEAIAEDEPRRAIREVLERASAGVESEDARRLLEAMRISVGVGLLPPERIVAEVEPLLLDRLSVSEQTGSLAPGLRDIARTCRAQLDKFLNTFTTSISAGVLVAAFSFVAFIAYAIVSAVFQVSSSFRF